MNRTDCKEVKYIKMTDIASNDKYKLALDQVRDFVAKRNSNGLKDAVRQIGTRYFILEHLFDEWYNKNENS